MNSNSPLRLKHRLLLAFGAITLSTAAALAIIGWQVSNVDAVNVDLQQNNFPQTALVTSYNDTLNARGISLRNLFSMSDESSRQKEC